MPVKSLKNAYLRVSVETQEQLDCAIETPEIDLIYIDAGLFDPEDWPDTVKRIHKGTGGMGKLAALRLPQVWRKRAEAFFGEKGKEWKTAGFDLYLARNPEEILWLSANGIRSDMMIADATVYLFNSDSEDSLFKLTGCDMLANTFPLELNSRELKSLSKAENQKHPDTERELTVYGRAPLMVTAQCLRKTSIGCDRRISQLWMKDRTGALMPVKNCCTFCCNTIYNSVPTALYDLKEEIAAIGPDHIRYEFTIESGQQMKQVLKGIVPEQFTRGHFKRGVL